MENGKTEEEICEELGSIEDLVEEIKEVYGADNKSSDSKQKKQEEKITRIFTPYYPNKKKSVRLCTKI